MTFTPSQLALTIGLIIAHSITYASDEGNLFQKEDWLIVCDNYNTCRAAGYSADTDEHQISVLLTRENNSAPITGKLIYQTDNVLTEPLTMRINDQSYGVIDIQNEKGILSAQQIQALLNHAKQNSTITFSSGTTNFQLSDKGLTSVLLKMDEVQNRVGTTSALIAKGDKTYTPYPMAQLALKNEKDFIDKAPTIIKRDSEQGQKLLHLLRTTVSHPDLNTTDDAPSCPDIFLENEELVDDKDLYVLQLSKTQKLVITSCWVGFYNVGNGVWVMNDTLTKPEEIITNSMTDYNNRTLFATHKIRDLGDCWSSTEWTWTGDSFTKTWDVTTGLCRGFAGGAWDLPLLHIPTDNHQTIDEN